MTEEQARKAAERLAAKRAAVLRPPRRKRRLVVPLLAAILVLGVAATLVARIIPKEKAKSAAGAMFSYVAESGEVTYPAVEFAGEVARFYQHKAAGGVLVRYFIHRAADGTVQAALDTCAECWREGRGHYQDGAEMVCSYCEKRFNLEALAETRDPCVPFPLDVRESNGQVAVAIPALAAAAKYFQQPYGSL